MKSSILFQLDVKAFRENVDLKNYVSNGEWELLEVNNTIVIVVVVITIVTISITIFVTIFITIVFINKTRLQNVNFIFVILDLRQ